MGISGTIAAVAAVASASASIYSAVKSKPKAPTFDSLGAPNPADAQIKADAASAQAAGAQRKKTSAAKGFSSTILTSPQGASLQPVTGRATLLGS